MISIKSTEDVDFEKADTAMSCDGRECRNTVERRMTRPDLRGGS